MVKLNMLKQDKNRKYNCPVPLALYGQTVEGKIYLIVVGRTGQIQILGAGNSTVILGGFAGF
jgi:hypothetical protein